MGAKKYIPLLITVALLALIGLQLFWLLNVYRYKTQELRVKTQEAVLETTKRLQKEQDSKMILNSLDSLVLNDNVIGSDSKEDIKVIVSKIKNKIKVDTFRFDTKIKRELRVIGDTGISTTVVSLKNGKESKVIVRSESSGTNIKKRAGDLQALFMKMAVESKGSSITTFGKLDFDHIVKLLKEELQKRGIDLEPEVYISSTNDNPKEKSEGFFTKNWYKADKQSSVPLYPEDFSDFDTMVHVGFVSKGNFLLGEMAGLLSLSLLITILIGFVMLHIFKRMINQEKLHQLKTDFINNMTHELKTPIATISLAIDSINNPNVRSDNSKIDNYTAIIKEENKKLDQHVERVLQMALLEKGEMVLEKKPVDLIKVIHDTIRSNQLKAESCKGSINFETSLQNAMIAGDEFGLKNAISNLIDNSLKYSNEPCFIRIKLEKENEVYLINVSDNGIGMDKKELTMIFDKFYRVQRGNLHDVKGTGLGLSYVRSIIELHNGTIEAESEAGKGSTFTIKLNANA